MVEFINSIPAFLLILVRITGFFATVPIFSYKNIPGIHKVGLSLILSFFVLAMIPAPAIELNGYYILYILKELLVGMSIGFIASIVLYALQVAGGFIDLQMGFAIANVFDPQTGIQSPLIGRYLYILAMLFLLTIDAHHMLLNGIFQSYQLVPIEGWSLSFGQGGMAQLVVETVSRMFYIAFQIAIPVVGCLFLVDLALGIISRTVPQVNVFIVGLPLKIGVSFIIILLITPMIFQLVQDLYVEMLTSMRKMMNLIGGP
ncbi:flagellar biosynthetic protein FliR [Alkalihalobacillus sp. AL-G]|uniref:flagellar biosynthetic protein FliR n=1 Tax=Alkalihalobacillus sp. AL-G TaxID=2926399 RepID=UPI00272BED0A|nr:flagellar biosynthetic protein FliR [Alkalihalobacillus sp. AL-G]WLD95168.1 flagellar type III secretion system protein FliR [Alkalihalobacillus sp. AL-G]